MFKRMKSLAAFLPLSVMLAAPPADAEAARFIRDAEIENTIRAYSAPLFAAAGLNSKDVKILIVDDDTLNAFVFGGMNLFIHTGLLLESEHAGQLIGVIAHETGHIAGGHLSRMSNRMRSASTAQIIAMILGAAVGIAGSPQAGSAILLGSGELARQGVFGSVAPRNRRPTRRRSDTSNAPASRPAEWPSSLSSWRSRNC